MIAFHNNQQLKKNLVAQLEAHYAADEIVKGQYWENGKGCAVGCCVHGSSHQKMSKKFNIPIEICYLIDSIFEGLPNDQAKEFPLQIIKSIKVGSDLSLAWNKFAVWLLVDPENGVIRFNSDPLIVAVADLHRRLISRTLVSAEEWDAARAATRAATRDATRDAASATRDAASAAARDAARDAARAAAWAAARDAAWDATSAAARDATWVATWAATRTAQAASLIQIITTTP